MVLGTAEDQQAAKAEDPETSELTDREKLALRFADALYLDPDSIDEPFFERMSSLFTMSEIVELAHFAMWFCLLHKINALFDIDPDPIALREYRDWRDGFDTFARPAGRSDLPSPV